MATCPESILHSVEGRPCLCDQKSDLLIDPNHNLPKHFHVIFFSEGQDPFFLPEGVEPQLHQNWGVKV